MCLAGCSSTSSPSADPGANEPACNPAVQTCACCSVLSIKELTFAGNHVVEKDTIGDFPSPEWVEGRAQSDQSPVSYARNTKISLRAKFKVTTAACRAGETVEITGTATMGAASLKWTKTVTVNPGDKEVTAWMSSDNPLPNAVGIFENSTISWQMNPCNKGSSSAGSTLNLIYVTLADPSGTPNYWTLLDISCRAAAGETTAAGVISKAFDALRGRAISRKRDGHDLTYWNPQGACSATNTELLLAAGNGAGQCGSWAEFLVDMYRVHGITNVDKILIVRTVAAWQGNLEGFLVKHWVFSHPPASAASSYTHWVPSQCTPGAYLPGQRNSAPPPAFLNHFIVRAEGKFWDPSYGAGPFVDQKAWENAAIDGLFNKVLPPGAPTGTTIQTGFDKSLNAATTIVEFWNLTTNSKL